MNPRLYGDGIPDAWEEVTQLQLRAALADENYTRHAEGTRLIWYKRVGTLEPIAVEWCLEPHHLAGIPFLSPELNAKLQ